MEAGSAASGRKAQRRTDTGTLRSGDQGTCTSCQGRASGLWGKHHTESRREQGARWNRHDPAEQGAGTWPALHCCPPHTRTPRARPEQETPPRESITWAALALLAGMGAVPGSLIPCRLQPRVESIEVELSGDAGARGGCGKMHGDPRSMSTKDVQESQGGVQGVRAGHSAKVRELTACSKPNVTRGCRDFDAVAHCGLRPPGRRRGMLFGAATSDV